MKRILRAVVVCLVALGASLALVSPAQAEETWCEADPPVAIKTPAGRLVVVYLVNGGPVEHTASLVTPAVSYTTRPAPDGPGTKVTLRVALVDRMAIVLGLAGVSQQASQQRRVVSRVWSAPVQLGRLHSQRVGTLGSVVWHEFTLPVA